MSRLKSTGFAGASAAGAAGVAPESKLARQKRAKRLGAAASAFDSLLWRSPCLNGRIISNCDPKIQHPDGMATADSSNGYFGKLVILIRRKRPRRNRGKPPHLVTSEAPDRLPLPPSSRYRLFTPQADAEPGEHPAVRRLQQVLPHICRPCGQRHNGGQGKQDSEYKTANLFHRGPWFDSIGCFRTGMMHQAAIYEDSGPIWIGLGRIPASPFAARERCPWQALPVRSRL